MFKIAKPINLNSRLILILVVVLCGVGGTLLFNRFKNIQLNQKISAEMAPVARQFLQCVMDNQPDKAYALTSAKFQADTDLKTLREGFKQYQMMAGRFGTSAYASWHWKRVDDENVVEIVYLIPCPSKDVTVWIPLVFERGAYRVLSVYVSAVNRHGTPSK